MSCGHCHADLRGGSAARQCCGTNSRNYPPITPVVIETRQAEVVCPACQRVTRGELPAGLEAGRSFGPRCGSDGGLSQTRAASEL